MAFNRNAFIQAAREQGATADEINEELMRQGQKPIGPAQKIVESALLPVVGGVLGGGIGSFVGPAGTVGGATAGTFTASALQNLLKDRMGIQTKQPGEQLTSAGNNAGTAFTLSSLLSALPYLSTSKWAQIRNEKLGKVKPELAEVPYGSVETPIKNINIVGQTPEQTGGFVNPEINRMWGSAEPATGVTGNTQWNLERQSSNLQKIQDWISTFDRLYGKKAFATPGGGISEKGEALKQLRAILAPQVTTRAAQGGQSIDTINKIMSALIKIKNTTKTLGKIGLYGGLGAGAATAVGYGIGKARSAISGE